ncbi:pentapeptide repeat-containing protein [Actinomyces trachealis]|uniref:pentapeptide repeat-containing protein n=1 Tax=Actinomyces trachealis TaxID=2763540 RepID=UPI001892893A|nr:pentapeptide repeat-containing protein [Actinomyces trachealis]
MARSCTAQGPRPPAVPRLALPELGAQDPSGLRRGAYLELTAFDGVDLNRPDLNRLQLDTCKLAALCVKEIHINGWRATETQLHKVRATSIMAQCSTWVEVEFLDSRIGALSMPNSDWRKVRVEGCRVNHLSLSGSTLSDVVLSNCQVDELDLTETTARRVSFPNTQIGCLRLRSAHLEDVDLRGATFSELDNAASLSGATISPEQLPLLAGSLASAIGIRVLKG